MVPEGGPNQNEVQPPILNPVDEMMPPVGQHVPQIQDQENFDAAHESDEGGEGELEDDREDDPEDDPEDIVRAEHSDSSDDSDDGETFPQCFPRNPPDVERLPFVEYPADAVRSSPSDRNREFARMVQNNFVPYQKGMKGESYRKRTNYEHQLAMG